MRQKLTALMQGVVMHDADVQEAWPNYGIDQAVVEGWVRRTHGDALMDSAEERVTRALEEQIELYQTEMTRDPVAAKAKAHLLVETIFSRKPGKPDEEAGDVMVTMMAYAACRGGRLDELARRKIDALIAGDREKFQKRQKEKADLGLADRPE